jgi:hypothetical protein
MMKMVPILTVAVAVGFGTPLSAEEKAAGSGGFSATSGSAASEGKTGESAECPIKKTIDGKTICFQNDLALAKPQGGH